MENQETECYSYFDISSEGEMKDGIKFVVNSNSDFEPDEITKKWELYLMILVRWELYEEIIL